MVTNIDDKQITGISPANDEAMKETDKELVKDIKAIIQRFLYDQKQKKPYHRVQEIPGEINGALSDIMFRDKMDNQVFIGFIIGLFYQAKNDKEILRTLDVAYSVLDSFDV